MNANNGKRDGESYSLCLVQITICAMTSNVHLSIVLNIEQAMSFDPNAAPVVCQCYMHLVLFILFFNDVLLDGTGTIRFFLVMFNIDLVNTDSSTVYTLK